jgi:hypothetical protein
MKLKNLQCVTCAPEEYDYGWAKTVIANLYTNESGKVFRLVQNEDQWHFDQQIMRYGSGMNLTISNQIQLDDYLRYGWLKPTEDPRPIYREYFDFEDLMSDASNDDIQRIVDCVEEIRSNPEVTLETEKGGYAYSLKVVKDKELFELVKTKLNNAIVKSVT